MNLSHAEIGVTRPGRFKKIPFAAESSRCSTRTRKFTAKTGTEPRDSARASIRCWAFPSSSADPKWAKRSGSMRICLNALWSLIYEEGPGKAEVTAAPTSSPKAYFQVACDREMAVLRLCFQMPSWTPRTALANFWPGALSPTSPAQLLLRYADFVRVHTYSNTPEVEIVAGLLSALPVPNRRTARVHTFGPTLGRKSLCRNPLRSSRSVPLRDFVPFRPESSNGNETSCGLRSVIRPTPSTRRNSRGFGRQSHRTSKPG